MSRKISALVGAMALTAGALVAVAQPASAAVGRLTLSLVPQYAGGVAKTVTLTCLPTGGTHPDAEASCADLVRAGGDILKIPTGGIIACPPVYRPITATATGRWGSQVINFSRTYGNECVVENAVGGHLFNF